MAYYTGRKTRASSMSTESTRDEPSTQLQDPQEAEAVSTEWTDQKHSLYLKSMEASFINQLHTSIDLLVESSQKDSDISQKVRCESCTSSGQFKVLRRGCWQRINFQKPMSRVDIENEHQGFMNSPWIRHFQSAKTPHVLPAAPLRESAIQRQSNDLGGRNMLFSGSATSSKPFRRHPLFAFQNASVDKEEASDQNFVDEDIKHEAVNGSRSPKRMKILKTSDHVVPQSEFSVMEDVSENCITQPHNELAEYSPN